MKKIKLRKISEIEMVVLLQDWILGNSNAELISIALRRHCRKFVKELQDIPLSEELQKVKKQNVVSKLSEKKDKQMKRTPLRKIGKIGKVNLEANRQLKKLFTNQDYCEIQLEGCLKTWPLQFCHRHKRAWYKGNVELLADRNQVVIGCQNCHEKIEFSKELTEEIFKKLRKQVD